MPSDVPPALEFSQLTALKKMQLHGPVAADLSSLQHARELTEIALDLDSLATVKNLEKVSGSVVIRVDDYIITPSFSLEDINRYKALADRIRHEQTLLWRGAKEPSEVTLAFIKKAKILKVSAWRAEAAKHIADLTQLRELEFRSGEAFIPQVGKLTQLEKLTLDMHLTARETFVPTEADRLQLANLTKLRYLDVGNLFNGNLDIIAALPELHTLVVRPTQASIPALKAHKSLKRLGLGYIECRLQEKLVRELPHLEIREGGCFSEDLEEDKE
jgi:hypothetical protein